MEIAFIIAAALLLCVFLVAVGVTWRSSRGVIPKSLLTALLLGVLLFALWLGFLVFYLASGGH